MEKQALSKQDLLKLLFGSALLAGSARAGMGYMSSSKASPSFDIEDEVKDEDDLYRQAIPVPVKMSPEEYARYRQLQAKTASMWDPTLATIAVAGGLGAGWQGADYLLEKYRKWQLKNKINKVKAELKALAAPKGFRESGEDDQEDDGGKVAVFAGWLDEVAEKYAAESVGFLDGLLSRFRDPASVMSGPGRAAGAVAALPGMAADTAGNVGSLLVKILGPIAAISLLSGAAKAFSEAKSKDTEAEAARKAVRSNIRRLEAEQQPYFEAVPYVEKRKAKAIESPKSTFDRGASPLELGLGYEESDGEESDENEKAASEKAASLGTILSWLGRTGLGLSVGILGDMTGHTIGSGLANYLMNKRDLFGAGAAHSRLQRALSSDIVPKGFEDSMSSIDSGYGSLEDRLGKNLAYIGTQDG